MKLRLISDLHMEGYYYSYTPVGEDLVVFAGDIHTRNRHEELIEQVPETTQIIMVAGNHEYYHREFHEVNRYLKSLETVYKNFKFLNNDSFVHDGVHFYGGTMYSDFYLYGQGEHWQTIADADKFIMDFRVSQIEDDGNRRIWSTDDHIKEHTKFRNGLQHWIRETEGHKRVVVSHFVPHLKAVHPRWGRSALNGYFTCDMDKHMGWEGLWLYGHTHDSGDFMVGDTRCVGNPRGYGDENRHGFEEEKILEI